MQCITRADQIESAAIRQLFLYWQSKCVEGCIPRRADIDPIDIPNLMPNIMIADIEHDPFRVRYRLVGARIVEMTGFEFTGKYLDEIALEDFEGPFQECYKSACETKSPIVTRIKWSLSPDTVVEYDACFLPLSDDGETANMALSLECYENIERDFTFFAGQAYKAGIHDANS